MTHPSADQIGHKPSIAAMVASSDPNVSVYNCEVRLQYPDARDKSMVKEVIDDTQAMFKALLMKFYDNNKGRKPEKIFYYRDGVSEGELSFKSTSLYLLVATSKTHLLRRSLWDSKPSPQNFLSFEPTLVCSSSGVITLQSFFFSFAL